MECKLHTSPCSAISPALTKQILPAQKFSGPSQQHCHFTSDHPTLTSSHLNTRRSWLLSLVNEEALLQTFSASTGNNPYRTSVAMENHH